MSDDTYDNYSSELTDADIQIAVGETNEVNPPPPLGLRDDSDEEAEDFPTDRDINEMGGGGKDVTTPGRGGGSRLNNSTIGRLSKRMSKRIVLDQNGIPKVEEFIPDNSNNNYDDVDVVPFDGMRKDRQSVGPNQIPGMKGGIGGRGRKGAQPLIRIESAVDALTKLVARRKLYRELAMYFVFMWLVVTVMFMGRYLKHVFLIQQSVDSIFVNQEFPESFAQYKMTYFDIGNQGEFWGWVNGPLLEGLAKTTWYNGQPYDRLENQTIVNFNKLIGSIRFRQQRVKKNSCLIPDAWSDEIRDCFGFYNFWNKDTEPFGPPSNPTKYKYSDTDDADGIFRFGWAASAYAPSGYIVDIPPTADFSAAFQELQNDRWTDQQTRSVFITINTLNPGLDMHACVATFLLEFHPGGSVWPLKDYRTMRLRLYETPYDFLRLFLEIATIAFVFYWSFKIILELLFAHNQGLLVKYFSKDPWNILEVFNIFLFGIVICLTISFIIATSFLDENLDKESYTHWEKWSVVYTTIYEIDAFIVLICFIKMFKFLRVNRRLSMLWSTLGKASSDLVAFTLFFLIIFLGFTFTGYLIWGPHLEYWSTVFGSFEILFQLTIGDSVMMAYNDMNKFNRVLTPLYFFLFVFLLFFALVNMFLAIISDSYAKEQMELHSREKKKKNAKKKRLERLRRNNIETKKPTLFHRFKESMKRKPISAKSPLSLLLKKLDDALDLDRHDLTVEELKQIAPDHIDHLLNLLELEGEEQFEQHHDDEDEDIELDQYQQIDLISQRQHVASNKLEEVNADLQDLLLQLALQAEEDGRTPRADGGGGEGGLTSRRMTTARSNAGSPNASGVLNRDGLTSARGPPSFFPTVSTLFPSASTLGLPQAQAQASPTRPSPPLPPPPTNDE